MKPFYALILLVALVITHCKPEDDSFFMARGTVRDAVSGEGIPNVAVVIASPEPFSTQYRSTDSSGVYIFDNLDVTEVTSITFSASKNGYVTGMETITAIPDNSETVDFDLVLEGSEVDDDDDDDEVVGGKPGVPAAIVLTDITETAINIRQTGGTVNSVFSFVVQDSAGRNMDENSPTDVHFQIIKGPNGGEAVVPETVQTNANGEVVSSLFSGNVAGVVRLEAFIIRDDDVRISSTPILVAINGGFPAADRFFVAPVNSN